LTLEIQLVQRVQVDECSKHTETIGVVESN